MGGAIALALHAFHEGALDVAASELARCPADADPATQVRIAREMEAAARAALSFGDRLVRCGITHPLAPAGALGQDVLDRLEPTLDRWRRPSEPKVCNRATTDAAAPARPKASPEEVERFLASCAFAPPGLLRAPFGSGRELRLVERNRQGRDIWWGGRFFAIRHGRSPHLAFLLIRTLLTIRDTLSGLRRWVRQARMAPRCRPWPYAPAARTHPHEAARASGGDVNRAL